MRRQARFVINVDIDEDDEERFTKDVSDYVRMVANSYDRGMTSGHHSAGTHWTTLEDGPS